MNQYYNVTDTIKTQLEADAFVNTVTHGDLFDIDLKKITMYPLSHVMINSVEYEGALLRFSVSVLAMDVVDISKVAVTDLFLSNDNEIDVLNTQLAVLTRLIKVLQDGANNNTFHLDGNPTIEPFTERFENYLAGWMATFDILVKHDMTQC
jgi:hypothetical protein